MVPSAIPPKTPLPDGVEILYEVDLPMDVTFLVGGMEKVADEWEGYGYTDLRCCGGIRNGTETMVLFATPPEEDDGRAGDPGDRAQPGGAAQG